MVKDSRGLGERIALARSLSGMTQRALGIDLGSLSPDDVGDMERGDRPVTASELARLAVTFGRSPDWFLMESPPAIVSHRGGAEAQGGLEVELETIARDVEFLVDLGRLVVPEKRRVLLPTPRTHEDALRAAAHVRAEVGCTSGPIRDLTALADDLDLFVFSLEAPENTEAAYVSVSSCGVAVVNGSLEPGRRRFNVAHEIGHHVFDDEYEVHWTQSGERPATEKFIDAFAIALMVPPAELRTVWADFSERVGDRDAAVVLSSHYRVSMSAFVAHLMTLRLIPGSRQQALAQARPTKDDFNRQLSTRDFAPYMLLQHDDLAPVTLSPRYVQAVRAAHRNGEIATSRAQELLRGAHAAAELTDVGEPVDALWSDVPW